MYLTPTIPMNLDSEILSLAERLCINSAKLENLHNQSITNSLKKIFRVVNVYYSNRLDSKEMEFSHVYDALFENRVDSLSYLSLAQYRLQLFLEEHKNNCKNPYTKEFITDIHKNFFIQKHMDEFLVLKNQNLSMRAGEFRDKNVMVRKHEAPSFGIIPLLFTQFEASYTPSLSHNKISKLIYALCSFHRVLWIHPFLFSNERIARIYLDFLMQFIDIEGYGLWSFSRGIRKNESEYKERLKQADQKANTINDGQGPLTNEGLREYLLFMLKIANEEIEYSLKNMQILPKRVQNYVKLSREGFFDAEELPKNTDALFEKIFLYGDVKRGDIKNIIQKQDRSATYFTQSLTKQNIIYSDTPRGDIKINFNAHFVQKLFPELV